MTGTEQVTHFLFTTTKNYEGQGTNAGLNQ